MKSFRNPIAGASGQPGSLAVAGQPLASLPVGSKAVVAQVRLSPDENTRLMEIGLVVGTPIELVRFAPLGDPVEIAVRGSHLSLRRHEAELILVVT